MFKAIAKEKEERGDLLFIHSYRVDCDERKWICSFFLLLVYTYTYMYIYAYVGRMERRREMFSSEATLVEKAIRGRDKVADSTKGAADMYVRM